MADVGVPGEHDEPEPGVERRCLGTQPVVERVGIGPERRIERVVDGSARGGVGHAVMIARCAASRPSDLGQRRCQRVDDPVDLFVRGHERRAEGHGLGPDRPSDHAEFEHPVAHDHRIMALVQRGAEDGDITADVVDVAVGLDRPQPLLQPGAHPLGLRRAALRAR